jgi:hypothetical protein
LVDGEQPRIETVSLLPSAFTESSQIAMRGSRPGERRGGRQKGTPNKKTALRNAAIAAIAADQNLTPLGLELAVMRAADVDLNTRIKMAVKALPFVHKKPKGNQPARARAEKSDRNGVARESKPEKSNGKTAPTISTRKAGGENARLMPLDFLVGVMRAPDTPVDLRIKLAFITGPYVHPKRTNAVPPKSADDQYGFVIDPAAAKRLRNDGEELGRLVKRRDTHFDEYTRKAPRLRARINEVREGLICPFPSLYGVKDYEEDNKKYSALTKIRRSKKKMTRAADAEHALLYARILSFKYGPEARARSRLDELRAKRRMAEVGGPPLSPAESWEFDRLSTFYPPERSPNYDSEIAHSDSAFFDLPAEADGDRPARADAHMRAEADGDMPEEAHAPGERS